MTTETWVLLGPIVLGLLDGVWIVVGWVADHRITTAARHRKERP